MTTISKAITWIDEPDAEFLKYLEASGFKLKDEDKEYPVRYAVTSDFYAFNNPDYIKYSLEKFQPDAKGIGSSTVILFSASLTDDKKTVYEKDEYGSYYRFYQYSGYDNSRKKTGVLVNNTRNIAITVLRFVNETLHCAYTPAYQRAELREISYVDESGNQLPEEVFRAFYNYNYRGGKRPVSADEVADAVSTLSKKWSRYSKNFLNGFPTTKEATAVAIKNNLSVTRASRIKMNGAMELGEEFEVFGYENHIVWVRNGMELWALDKPYRKSPKVSALITKERKHLGIEEKDITKFILTSPDKLEEMVAYSIQAMLTSVTAT